MYNDFSGETKCLYTCITLFDINNWKNSNRSLYLTNIVSLSVYLNITAYKILCRFTNTTTLYCTKLSY